MGRAYRDCDTRDAFGIPPVVFKRRHANGGRYAADT